MEQSGRHSQVRGPRDSWPQNEFCWQVCSGSTWSNFRYSWVCITDAGQVNLFEDQFPYLPNMDNAFSPKTETCIMSGIEQRLFKWQLRLLLSLHLLIIPLMLSLHSQDREGRSGGGEGAEAASEANNTSRVSRWKPRRAEMGEREKALLPTSDRPRRSEMPV